MQVPEPLPLLSPSLFTFTEGDLLQGSFTVDDGLLDRMQNESDSWGYFTITIEGNEYIFESDSDDDENQRMFFFCAEDLPSYCSGIHFFINYGENKGNGYFVDEEGNYFSFDKPAITVSKNFKLKFTKWKPYSDSDEGAVIF